MPVRLFTTHVFKGQERLFNPQIDPQQTMGEGEGIPR
jgi:hypothetical protein